MIKKPRIKWRSGPLLALDCSPTCLWHVANRARGLPASFQFVCPEIESMTVARCPWRSLAVGVAIGCTTSGPIVPGEHLGERKLAEGLRISDRVWFLLFPVPRMACALHALLKVPPAARIVRCRG